MKEIKDDVKQAHILTFTGKKFFLLDPKLEDIDIVDIAHSLSMQCRWTGHCRYHYSVAQHSYYCSFIGPQEEALERLMHDASEAYIADMSRPLKHYTDAGRAYMEVEKVVQGRICQHFGLPETQSPSVNIADQQMLKAEYNQLTNGGIIWGSRAIDEDFGAAGVEIEKWTPEQAKTMFLRRFYQLTEPACD